jgi:hypothetical protein
MHTSWHQIISDAKFFSFPLENKISDYTLIVKLIINAYARNY